FAHSDVVTWGAWIGFTMTSAFGFLESGGAPWFAFPMVLLLTMAACALMGVTIERFAYRPLRSAPRLNIPITAIGVSLFLENFGQLEDLFGNPPKSIAPLLANTELFTVLSVPIRLFDVLAIGLAALLVWALDFLVHHTKLGRAMRAVNFDERIASL